MASARNFCIAEPDDPLVSSSPLLNFLSACMAAAAPRPLESACELSSSTKYFLWFLTASKIFLVSVPFLLLDVISLGYRIGLRRKGGGMGERTLLVNVLLGYLVLLRHQRAQDGLEHLGVAAGPGTARRVVGGGGAVVVVVEEGEKAPRERGAAAGALCMPLASHLSVSRSLHPSGSCWSEMGRWLTVARRQRGRRGAWRCQLRYRGSGMIMVVSSGVHTLVLVPRDGADDLVHGEVYCTVSRRVLFFSLE